jgi:hypothetical protein
MESKEVNLPSKCRVTDVADDHPQNSCEEPYTLQVVQKLAACNKQLRSQFAAEMCAHILEHDNFVTDEAKFHIFGHVSWWNYVIWGSELPT